MRVINRNVVDVCDTMFNADDLISRIFILVPLFMSNELAQLFSLARKAKVDFLLIACRRTPGDVDIDTNPPRQDAIV